jgi:tetratricopeptide (TPR) repeat protein
MMVGMVIACAGTSKGEAYFNKGVDFSEQGLYAEAIQMYDKAIEINSKDASFYFKRGFAYDLLSEYPKAIEDYSKAIELDPKYGVAYFNKGLIHSNLGRYQQAFQDFNKVVELDPDHDEAREERQYAATSIWSQTASSASTVSEPKRESTSSSKQEVIISSTSKNTATQPTRPAVPETKTKPITTPTQEVISPTASKIIPTQDVITLPLIPSPNADEIKAIDRRLSALETKIVAIADLEDRLDTFQEEIYGRLFFSRINIFTDSRIDDLEDDVRSLENDVRSVENDVRWLR